VTLGPGPFKGALTNNVIDKFPKFIMTLKTLYNIIITLHNVLILKFTLLSHRIATKAKISYTNMSFKDDATNSLFVQLGLNEVDTFESSSILIFQVMKRRKYTQRKG
jgi:hypothetical protein